MFLIIHEYVDSIQYHYTSRKENISSGYSTQWSLCHSTELFVTRWVIIMIQQAGCSDKTLAGVLESFQVQLAWWKRWALYVGLKSFS